MHYPIDSAMISIEQLRAARALLDWKQSDLARAAHLSLKAVSKIEGRQVTPRTETLRILKSVLEQQGVEFLPDHGVKLRSDVLEVYKFEGADAFALLLEDIFNTLMDGGGEVLVSAVDEKKFTLHAHDILKNYYERAKAHNIHERILVPEGDSHFIAPRSWYRHLPPDDIDLVPYNIYRDKLAIISWGPPLRIVIVRNPAMAESFRRQFEGRWKKAKAAT